MTKTQALQRLYKALTNKDGRNTSTKVIEDLAVAAENGDIGGGGDYDIFHVTITDADGSGQTFYLPHIVTEDGITSLMCFYMPSGEPETIDVVGYGEGTVCLVTGKGLEVTGDIQKNETGVNTILMISGDGTISTAD